MDVLNRLVDSVPVIAKLLEVNAHGGLSELILLALIVARWWRFAQFAGQFVECAGTLLELGLHGFASFQAVFAEHRVGACLYNNLLILY